MTKCRGEGCKKNACFNIKGEKGRYCKTHKTPEMINVIDKRCAHEGCESIHPVFNIKGEKGKFCKVHKTAEMIDVKNKQCSAEGCDSQPTYDIEGGKGSHCKNHKTDKMVDIRHKKCNFKGCTTRPSFGMEKDNRPSYCVEHKTKEMINIVHILCRYEGCITKPSYGVRGTTSPLYCSAHKKELMIDLKHHQCRFDGCEIRPCYGVTNGRAEYCVKHKKDGMDNVVSKRCQFNNCNFRAYYGIKEDSPKFCKEHKEDTMIILTTRPNCSFEGCETQPTYNLKGYKKGKFCIKHKTDEMVDVRHKLCEEESCKIRAYYGKPGYTVSHCLKHKEKGMISRPNAKCVKCKEFAFWGTNWIPKHCELHKEQNDINLVERICSSCGLIYLLDKENKCENCSPTSFQTTRLAKQNALMDYLDSHNLAGLSTDKTIDNGVCGKERPDRVFDLEDKIIILECDEHQHRDRSCECEQTRMANIGQSYGGLPVYFIRWNPDNYSTDTKKIPEVIFKRYVLVGDLITDIKNAKYTKLPNALVSVIYMYFDGWKSLKEEEWNIITPYEI